MTLPSQRHLFDIPANVAYLDGAAYSPLPRSVRAAGEAGVLTKSQPWASPRSRENDWAERARAAAAGLIGASVEDVAIVSAVSHGIGTAARNLPLPLPAGSRMLRVQDEFPSVSLVWDRLAAKAGAVADVVPRPADGDWTRAVLEAIARPGAPPLAVACLTPLHWSDGAVIDLDRIAPAVHAAGAALVVDATQAVGAMPVDVARWQPDFLAFPTYKWVLGPYSLAFLYAAPHRQSGLPLEENQVNRPGGQFAPGARRYDKGERNDPIALPMAATGLELVASWGTAAVEARLRSLTDRLAEDAMALGIPALPRALRAPHILGLRIPGGMPPGLIEALAAAGVYASDRLGVLRVSPHVWAEEADCDRFRAALARALGRS
ncbi:aminotransferase class V-fold PLP-dependent enzyme [Pseudoroseomonas wenyumeiae]|uniref:Aminotransferase class V-fold PLP-dependent enzyme n=1 Tax=Teichococcus wenyumeiae TaxID=2478470 RepID=A0A3A9JTF5_9PROT|nr:aminotransferase class V-fold PLP-dependent enzyme [Pseudoroseomonas wenyumeiae]RKK03998.1 aminotransferase class V-fold PLP-dependent enzyme [Pseudoroseomonas wenyumeiae]RMI19396.1 aminotransferase class V-fold PLP-dependent enzyme [Pseudoroseomonas wenyumeiae]RMI20293.1 aminotransferase class V-fold PLP-dependent enzyme [Pseudoroseomonas wenyumeiae]